MRQGAQEMCFLPFTDMNPVIACPTRQRWAHQFECFAPWQSIDLPQKRQILPTDFSISV
jgi:hypothetical protein